MNKQLSLKDLKLSKIKLPKGISITNIVLIVIGITLLGLAIYFAISYFGAVSTRTNLNRDIQLKHQIINSIGGPQNIAGLQSQLEVAQQDLIDESPFPFEIDTIEATSLILQAHTDAHLDCLNFNPSSKTPSAINGHGYFANGFSISSSGTGGAGEKMNRIIKFLNNIEELPYNAITISGLSLSSVSSTDQTWSMTFQLSILSQQ